MNDDLWTIRVECAEAPGSEPTPRRFWLHDHAVGATEVLDRWLAADHRYFKLKGDDGHIYILRHDTADDRWELTFFQRNA
jgi:hypothetical protein